MNLSRHLAFTTKYRKKVFTSDKIRADMVSILRLIAYGKDVKIDEIEVMDDHVHMLISFAPKVAASSVVRYLKGASAREWFKKAPLYQWDALEGAFVVKPLLFVNSR